MILLCEIILLLFNFLFMTYSLNFLTKEQVAHIAENYKTPTYVYSEKKLKEAVMAFDAFPSAF